MGDRAVLFIEGASCAVYLHWGGSRVAVILRWAETTMREADPDYATARLIAVCCAELPGKSGVGVLPPPADLNNLSDYSHGDAGVFILPASSGIVRTAEGYGFQVDKEEPAPFTLTYRGDQ